MSQEEQRAKKKKDDDIDFDEEGENKKFIKE